MRLTVQKVSEYVGGSYLVPPSHEGDELVGISWDSREVAPGFVYVALPGVRVDGHDFIPQALEAGAGCVIASHAVSDEVCELAREKGAAVLLVEDTYACVTDLAKGWRGHLSGKVIALTGSVGKTTTKNLVRDVLSTTFSTWATKANQNNELGVPKTLLDADADTQCVVVEMGMRGSGQLASLCEFVKPDMALVTNCGECHIELLGSREAIAKAKAEAVAALPEGRGVAVLNLADERIGIVEDFAQVEQRRIRVAGFDGTGSRSDEAVAWASDVVLDDQGRPRFALHLPDGVHDVRLALRGAHNVSNACAAAALAFELGVPSGNIVKGLESSLPEGGRQEVITCENGTVVINDAYNANPDSMKAALSMFCSMDVKGRRIAVLGDMGELGSFASAGHEGVGEFLSSLAIDRLVCVGSLSRLIAEAAVRKGFPSEAVSCVSSNEEVVSLLKNELVSGDAVLCKASHSMELDKVVKELID